MILRRPFRFLLLLVVLLLPVVVFSQTPVPTYDPGYCGKAPFETGTWDPFYKVCRPHDLSFNAHKIGKNTKSFLETTGDFNLGLLQTTAVNVFDATYSIIFGLPYAALGTIGGGILWALAARKRDEDT